MEFGHCGNAHGEIHCSDRRRHNAQGQKPLKYRGSPPAALRRQALRQIQRHHHPDQPGADALQQPAKQQQRRITVRHGDDGDADDKQNATDGHKRFTAQPISQHTGKKCGDGAAKENCGDDD